MLPSSRDDIVQKKVSEISRDAERCAAKLTKYVEAKYSHLDIAVVLSGLYHYSRLMRSFLTKMGERDEVEAAEAMLQIREQARSKESDKLVLELSEDEDFACGNDSAGISMYCALLSLIRNLDASA